MELAGWGSFPRKQTNFDKEYVICECEYHQHQVINLIYNPLLLVNIVQYHGPRTMKNEAYTLHSSYRFAWKIAGQASMSSRRPTMCKTAGWKFQQRTREPVVVRPRCHRCELTEIDQIVWRFGDGCPAGGQPVPRKVLRILSSPDHVIVRWLSSTAQYQN
jgi:hypothetical protein